MHSEKVLVVSCVGAVPRLRAKPKVKLTKTVPSDEMQWPVLSCAPGTSGIITGLPPSTAMSTWSRRQPPCQFDMISI